ncbi:MAG: hypothetical protein AMXMBFR58_29460 [Phycisphaerae bacterium]
MEEVHDLFPEQPYKTRVWVTRLGEREMDDLVPDWLAAKLEIEAEKGLADYRGPALRPEGDGVFAFGTQESVVRIAGYFHNDNRQHYVIGGAYRKKGNKIGAKGKAVIKRVAELKATGVRFVE